MREPTTSHRKKNFSRVQLEERCNFFLIFVSFMLITLYMKNIIQAYIMFQLCAFHAVFNRISEDL